MVSLYKLLYAATFVWSAMASIVPGGVAHMFWSIRGAPKEGASKLYFSFKVHKVTQSGYYLATNFDFVDRKKQTGDTGIQPQADGSARAVFSIESGATVVDYTNCHGDGRNSGVKCSVRMNQFEIGKRYYFVVERDTSNHRIWRGTVKDMKGYQQVIGAWQVGSVNTLDTHKGQVGTLQYFRETQSCHTTPYIDGTWYAPHIDDADAEPSRAIGPASAYGVCRDVTKISQTHLTNYDATRVRAGF